MYAKKKINQNQSKKITIFGGSTPLNIRVRGGICPLNGGSVLMRIGVTKHRNHVWKHNPILENRYYQKL